MSSAKTKTDFKSLSSSTQKKIESPFAKYNSIGQLSCIVCNQVVKSEILWNTHLNSKVHVENKNKLKMKLISENSKATPEPPVSKTTETNVVQKEQKTKVTLTNHGKLLSV